MSELLLDRPDPAVAVLTLVRPDRRNALSISLRDEISDALDGLAADSDLKVVIVTGTGSVFSAGFDLREFETAVSDADFATRLWASSDRYHRTVFGFPLPTVAAVNGPAIAGGFDLALCCDLRVASTSARFSHPEYTFGDVIYAPLHDLVGGAIARELTMTGRELSAQEALDLHLVHRLVEPADVLSSALELAHQVARAPRENLLRTKAKALRRMGIDPAAGTLDL